LVRTGDALLGELDRRIRLTFGMPQPAATALAVRLFGAGGSLARLAPAIAGLQGARAGAGIRGAAGYAGEHEATLATAVRRRRDREQALRVRLERRGGALVAVPNGPQGSHIVTSLLGADALALVPAGAGQLEIGARVALVPLPR